MCATKSDLPDEEVWEEYDKAVDRLSQIIIREVKEHEDDIIDGREWCEENDVPESAFADAVDRSYPYLEYGVSPMHPWLGPGDS